ncbi:MAG: hypothetical protein ABH833_02290 [Parcubacteria group bacterium]
MKYKLLVSVFALLAASLLMAGCGGSGPTNSLVQQTVQSVRIVMPVDRATSQESPPGLRSNGYTSFLVETKGHTNSPTLQAFFEEWSAIEGEPLSLTAHFKDLEIQNNTPSPSANWKVIPPQDWPKATLTRLYISVQPKDPRTGDGVGGDYIWVYINGLPTDPAG